MRRPLGACVRLVGGAAVACAAFGALPVLAADFNFNSEQWGDFNLNWNNRLTAGAAVRVKQRNDAIIDKSNVPGQTTLCAKPVINPNIPPASAGFSIPQNNDCTSIFGDPTPSQVLLNARGGYNINGDDGDLNYGPGDITYAGTSLRSTLSGSWRNFSFKVGGIGIYDPVNSHFNTHSGDLLYPGRGVGPINLVPTNPPQPGLTALQNQTILLNRPTRRHSDLETEAGRRVQLLEAFVSGDFTLPNEHKLRMAVGKQYLRWGESTFMLFNNLNQINPLSAPLYRFPGSEVKDAYLPTNLVSASYDLASKVTVSGFYQLSWQATEPDVCGTYMSVSDVANCGNGPTPVYLGAGNYPEDPNNQMVAAGLEESFTSNKRTTYLLDKDYGKPHNGGQFGLRLDYYADWLNGGTELSAYGMNIHSRLPYFSAYAANQSCIELGGQGQILSRAGCSLDVSTLAKATAYQDAQTPLDTIRPFLEYPEDIHIFGASFNSTLGNWSLAGEMTYSPNQPAQVSVVDVAYAALQPALPDPPGPPGAHDHVGALIPGAELGNITAFPSNRVTIPDYLETVYRHHKVQAGDYIQGWERLRVGQVSLTGIRIFSGSNWIDANQILFAGEIAGIRVFGMPERHSLQFEGGAGSETHYSIGQAEYDPKAPGMGTAANSYTDRTVISPLDVANPVRASGKDFADSFAWGYRFRLNATYDDVWHGIGMTPGLEVWHDVMGTSISPGQDFVRGRIQATFSNEFKFSQSFTSLLRYQMFAGGGYRNNRIDRDYAEVSFTYSF